MTWPGTSSRTSGLARAIPCGHAWSRAPSGTKYHETWKLDRDLFFGIPTGVDTFSRSCSRAEDVISRSRVERFGEDRLALAASWQKETAVLVDLVHDDRARRADLHARHRRAVRGDLRHLARASRSATGSPSRPTAATGCPGMWATDPDRCCFLRKVEPLERALAGADCWISGVRRDQSPDRASTEELDWDARHGLWKANPLADWTRARRLGLHQRQRPPLQPAARPGLRLDRLHALHAPGRGRAGRWAGLDKTECGIHVPASR